MVEFASWQSYVRFVNAVYRNRFVHDEETREFLAAVAASADNRVYSLDAQSELARAQMGCDWVLQDESDEDSPEIAVGYPAVRMKPIRGKAREGRANPHGITYLYLSDSVSTAIAEMRPWVGAHVSVAIFRTNRDLRLVDCSKRHRRVIVFGDEPSPDKRSEYVWSSIDLAFARPVTPDETSPAYVPTQILSELFRTLGYDGVLHRSSVGDGRNVILFEMDDANFLISRAFEVKSIDYNFNEA